jgi:hypothetical protein
VLIMIAGQQFAESWIEYGSHTKSGCRRGQMRNMMADFAGHHNERPQHLKLPPTTRVVQKRVCQSAKIRASSRVEEVRK